MESCHFKLLKARSRDKDYERYCDIRAKLAINRLICKFIFLDKNDRLSLGSFHCPFMHFVNNKWVKNKDWILGGDPFTLFYEGVTSKDQDIEYCLKSRLGVWYPTCFKHGYSMYEKNTIDQHATLFYSIALQLRVIFNNRVGPSPYKRIGNLSLAWITYIEQEWTRQLTLAYGYPPAALFKG